MENLEDAYLDYLGRETFVGRSLHRVCGAFCERSAAISQAHLKGGV